MEDLNVSDSEELAETIETDCQEVGIKKEQLKIIMGRSSLWLILISRVKLDAERLKRVVEKFLEKQRKKLLAWAFATAPSEAPSFAAPGLWRAVCILEKLGGIVGIPRIVCLRSCFQKDRPATSGKTREVFVQVKIGKPFAGKIQSCLRSYKRSDGGKIGPTSTRCMQLHIYVTRCKRIHKSFLWIWLL